MGMLRFWMVTQSRDSRQQKVSARGARRKGEDGEEEDEERLWKWMSLTEASTFWYIFFRSGPKDGVVEEVAP